MDAGHGGQTLVSAPVAALLTHHELVDHGRHLLKGLTTAEQLFQVGHRAFPPLRTVQGRAGNLPDQLTSFVGRDREVAALIDTVAEHRVVTLIGVGGTGKTRLAIETAAIETAAFPDGCWLVELAVIAEPEAGAVRVRERVGDHPARQSRRHRDSGRVATAPEGSGHCRQLRTPTHRDSRSRRVDRGFVSGGHGAGDQSRAAHGQRRASDPRCRRWRTLTLISCSPSEHSPSGPTSCSTTSRPTPSASCANDSTGCRWRWSWPASRVRAFTPVELVSNLEERFRMLVGGRRSAMERHQTMRGTLDWSYELCTDMEQGVFDRLSVFPAGFDMSAARTVAGGDGVSEFDVVDVVPHLVDRSLLQRSTAADGTSRYRMLETMRAYGREHLQHQGTGDRTRARHALHMAGTISALTLRTLGPDEQQVTRRLNDYAADSRVALDWFIDHQDWQNALRTIAAGAFVSDPESEAMVLRLHGAALSGGASSELIDEIESRDSHYRLIETTQQKLERGWRVLRARQPIPVDRIAISPHRNFVDGGLAATDVDEFLDSLDHWLTAPPTSRLWAQWHAIRALIYAVHLDVVDELLSGIRTLATELNSAHATRLVDELHGMAAKVRGDWAGAPTGTARSPRPAVANCAIGSISLRRGTCSAHAVCAPANQTSPATSYATHGAAIATNTYRTWTCTAPSRPLSHWGASDAPASRTGTSPGVPERP